MSQFLVIEIVDHTVSQVKPFTDERAALAFARGLANDCGYTDGYQDGDDRARYDADWWADGDPANGVCVFDLHGQCIIPQGDLL